MTPDPGRITDTSSLPQTKLIAGVNVLYVMAMLAEYSHWTRYLDVIDQRLGDVVDIVEETISTKSLPLEGWTPPQASKPL